MFSKPFRLNLTQSYQSYFFFGSVIQFFCLYVCYRHPQIVIAVSNARDNLTKHVPTVGQPTDATTTHSSENSSLLFVSTCSAAADRRGYHQNVIAYSLYSSNFSEPKFKNLYLRSFTDTLRTIPIKYPGWVVRIYHELRSDDVENWRVLNHFLDLGMNVSRYHIDLCNATQVISNRKLGDLFEMTWRWLPLLDVMVSTLMSRDSDSAIIPREQDAVAEWLASNKTFHLMRDHPQHCSFFVGCCWGVKISQNRSAIFATAEKMFHENHLHKKDYDQQLLNRLFQSMATKSMIAHDSYCCQQFKGSQPYPTPRRNNWFIGAALHTPKQPELRVPCPEKCRPRNLTGTSALADWSLC